MWGGQRWKKKEHADPADFADISEKGVFCGFCGIWGFLVEVHRRQSIVHLRFSE